MLWATSAARDLQLMCGADWGIAEVGAAGPSFHRATGVDAASGSGFAVVAVVGPPADERAEADRVWVRVCETGHARWDENMWQFAAAAASLAARCVEGSERADNAAKEKDAGDDVLNDEWREALDAAMRVVR